MLHLVWTTLPVLDKKANKFENFPSVGVILPTTAYILRLRPPPVRKMIDEGVIGQYRGEQANSDIQSTLLVTILPCSPL